MVSGKTSPTFTLRLLVMQLWSCKMLMTCSGSSDWLLSKSLILWSRSETPRILGSQCFLFIVTTSPKSLQVYWPKWSPEWKKCVLSHQLSLHYSLLPSSPVWPISKANQQDIKLKNLDFFGVDLIFVSLKMLVEGIQRQQEISFTWSTITADQATQVYMMMLFPMCSWYHMKLTLKIFIQMRIV